MFNNIQDILLHVAATVFIFLVIILCGLWGLSVINALAWFMRERLQYVTGYQRKDWHHAFNFLDTNLNLFLKAGEPSMQKHWEWVAPAFTGFLIAFICQPLT